MKFHVESFTCMWANRLDDQKCMELVDVIRGDEHFESIHKSELVWKEIGFAYCGWSECRNVRGVYEGGMPIHYKAHYNYATTVCRWISGNASSVCCLRLDPTNSQERQEHIEGHAREPHA